MPDIVFARLLRRSVAAGSLQAGRGGRRRVVAGISSRSIALLNEAPPSLSPLILPHCTGLDALYDDGIGQEVTMKTGACVGAEHFRSVWTCDPRTLSIGN